MSFHVRLKSVVSRTNFNASHSILRSVYKPYTNYLRIQQYKVSSLGRPYNNTHINSNPIKKHRTATSNIFTSSNQFVSQSSIIQNRSFFLTTSHSNKVPSQIKSKEILPLYPPSQPNPQRKTPPTPKVNQTLFQKVKSNVKWILIRNKERPFSRNELGTLFSWLIISQIVWIILKTTTVVSLLLLAINTIFAKELVGETIGKLLNYFIDDIDVKFQDALIPEWKSGLIRFNNVELKTNKDQTDDIFSFDMKFQQVEMNLSLKKWLSGKGLINDIKIYGMNGSTDILYSAPTRHINKYKLSSDENNNTGLQTSQGERDQLLIRWFSNPKYQLNNITISNSNITVNESYANGESPIIYKISVFNLEIPKLRFNQMITDFLNATVISGSINNSLFTFHKRQQKIGYLNNNIENDLGNWQRITRLRINSINIKDLGLYSTKSFNWLQEGNVDIIADIMLPFEDEPDLLTSNLSDSNEEKYIVVDLKFVFKDLKAILPADPPSLSTGENIVTLNELKPIVSYVNLQRALTQFQNMSSNDDDKITAHTILFRDSPEISIRRRKSYPDMKSIRNNRNSNKKQHFESDKLTDSIKAEQDKNVTTISASTSASSHSSMPITNELALRARLVRNVKSLENKVLFQETGIYDHLSMELYVDLMKIVEEWEYKNKDEWLKRWGNGLASQLLLFGFASPV